MCVKNGLKPHTYQKKKKKKKGLGCHLVEVGGIINSQAETCKETNYT